MNSPESLIGQIKAVIDSEVSRCADDRIGRNYKLAVMNVWNRIEPIFIREAEQNTATSGSQETETANRERESTREGHGRMVAGGSSDTLIAKMRAKKFKIDDNLGYEHSRDEIAFNNGVEHAIMVAEKHAQREISSSTLIGLFSDIWKKIESAKHAVYTRDHASIKEAVNNAHSLCRPFWDELTAKPLVGSSEIPFNERIKIMLDKASETNAWWINEEPRHQAAAILASLLPFDHSARVPVREHREISLHEMEIDFTCERTKKRWKFKSLTKLVEAFLDATQPKRESGNVQYQCVCGHRWVGNLNPTENCPKCNPPEIEDAGGK